MHETVNAVVLNYNQHEATLRCAQELRESAGVNVDVLVVDCASQLHDRAMLIERIPSERLLLLPENIGYAGGMNAGAAFWQERAPDSPLMLVTPDTHVARDVAALLRQALDADDAIGAVGPVIVYREKPTSKIGAGGDIRRGKITLHPNVQASDPYDVDWIEGCCVMLRPRALRSVGGLDEDYFLYFEDVDLCHQLKRANWRIQVVPAARVRHPKPIGKQPAHYYYYVARNGYRFWSKNFDIPAFQTGARIAASAMWLLAIAAASMFIPTRWRELSGRWRDGRLAARGAWLGTRDHLKGRYGPSAPTTRPT